MNKILIVGNDKFLKLDTETKIKLKKELSIEIVVDNGLYKLEYNEETKQPIVVEQKPIYLKVVNAKDLLAMGLVYMGEQKQKEIFDTIENGGVVENYTTNNGELLYNSVEQVKGAFFI